MSNPIKVVLGSNIKRESVLIDPRISAAEPTATDGNLEAINVDPNKNVLATGTSSREVLKKIYGR